MRRLSLWILSTLLFPVLAWSQALDRRHAGIINPLEYGSTCSAATLNAAISAAPASRRVLMLTPVDRTNTACTWTLTANVTVPATMTLRIPPGVAVSVGSGVTLSLGGMLEAGPYSIFSGAGSVLFAAGHRIPDVYPQWWGAVGDNVTNSRSAIQAAIAALGSPGGTVRFLPGTYYVSGVNTVSLAIPVAGAAFAPATESVPYHFLVSNVTGLRFLGEGVTIRSDYTGGGSMFLFNGVRDLVWEGLTLESVTTFNSAGTVSVAGMHGLGFTSTTQDSERLTIRNYRAVSTYSSVYVFGAGPTVSTRVRGLSLTNILHVNTYYGLAFHDNGDNAHYRGIRTVGGARGLFLFGVRDHDGALEIDAGTPDVQGFAGVLIKAYDLNTENITLKVRYNRASTSNKVNLESQHNVAAQPTPAKVRNIVLDYNEQGYAGGGGINFAYYQDAVVQATSTATIFDNITLRGLFENDITTQTVFSGAGLVKLDLAGTRYLAGSPTILHAQGFYTQAHQVYTPVLRIGGASTGITYTTQSGSFWEEDNLVFGTLEILLSNKGALTGTVTVTLPRTIAAITSRPPVFNVLGLSGMTGLTGMLVAFGSPNTTSLTLLQMGATGATSLSDAALTNTSRLIISFTYPK